MVSPLPTVLASARASPGSSRPASQGTGGRSTRGSRPYYALEELRPQTSPSTGGPGRPHRSPGSRLGGGSYGGSSGSRCSGLQNKGLASSTPRSYISEGTARVQEVAQWIQQQLVLHGLEDVGPSEERVSVFSEALGQIMDMLPTFRPLLVMVQKEYEELIARLRDEVHASEHFGCRMKTLKAESLHFVAESMTWFQKGVADMHEHVHVLEEQNRKLLEERGRFEKTIASLLDLRDEDRRQAEDTHTTGMDMVKLVRRLESEIEVLRKSEQSAIDRIGDLAMKVKEKELRIQAVESQLQAEHTKHAHMPTLEEHRELEDKLHRSGQHCQELEDRNEGLELNYRRLLETYGKAVGQTLSEKDLGNAAARPLTPRPIWNPCHGCLDPTPDSSSWNNAIAAQQLLEHVLLSARSLVSAYGLEAVAQQSPIFQRYVLHFAASQQEQTEQPDLAKANLQAPAQGYFSITGADCGDTLNLDLRDKELPEGLRVLLHGRQGQEDAQEGLPNWHFSRSKVSNFVDSLIQIRLRRGGVTLARPLIDVMLEHLPAGIKETQDALPYVANMYVATRRYAAEPDFLAYLLLFSGKISDSVVSDNKSLCSKLRTVFGSLFQKPNGNANKHVNAHVSKQKLFYTFREILPNKAKEMWQDLMSYFPPGGPETLVNYEALLLDDKYILSPIVYALRLQHLEETVALSEQLEKIVLQDLGGKGPCSRITFGELQAAMNADEVLSGISQDDLAMAFGTPASELHPHTTAEVGRCLSLLKENNLFRKLFFPLAPSGDDIEQLRAKLESLETHRRATGKEEHTPEPAQA